jgi:hypothetical protein
MYYLNKILPLSFICFLGMLFSHLSPCFATAVYKGEWRDGSFLKSQISGNKRALQSESDTKNVTPLRRSGGNINVNGDPGNVENTRCEREQLCQALQEEKNKYFALEKKYKENSSILLMLRKRVNLLEEQLKQENSRLSASEQDKASVIALCNKQIEENTEQDKVIQGLKTELDAYKAAFIKLGKRYEDMEKEFKERDLQKDTLIAQLQKDNEELREELKNHSNCRIAAIGKIEDDFGFELVDVQ